MIGARGGVLGNEEAVWLLTLGFGFCKFVKPKPFFSLLKILFEVRAGGSVGGNLAFLLAGPNTCFFFTSLGALSVITDDLGSSSSDGGE